jgi:leader peptidase (prepilin peptidase)/N-methyltransferase
MTTTLGAVLAFVGGAIIGSFLNVVAYRLPRGESLSRPASRCPSCGTPIKPYDNVPVLSWLLLRGRCRQCHARISPRYPIVEAVTGLLCAGVVIAKGADADAWLGLAFVLVLVPITLIDLDVRLIPNVLTLIGAIAALVIQGVVDPDSLVEALIAGAAAGGFFLLAVLAYPRGMGMGDVKLAGMMGLFLGRAVAPAIFVALIAGTVVGAVIIARVGAERGRKTAIPFGPYLALGGLVGLYAGDAIVDWYLDTFT